MLTKYRPLLLKITIFFSALILFTWGLTTQEIVSFDSRFYLFAREMLQNGVGLFPTTYSLPYPDYLSTSTWMIYLTAKIFGELNKLIAVLPTALMGAMTLVFTYSLGARFQRRYGWCAIVMLLTTVPFLKSARGITLDMYTVFFCTAIFYVLINQPEKCLKTVVLFLILLASFTFRGPIGFVMPAGIVCSYYFIEQRYKQLFLFGLLATLLLLLCTTLLLLAAYHTGGKDFLDEVLSMQIFGRMQNAYLSHFYYFIAGIKDYGLCFLLAYLSGMGVIYYGLYQRNFNEIEKFLLHALGWMFIIMIGMSIPAEKKIRYILPALPAAALLAAYVFIAPQQQKYFRYLRRVVLTLLTIAPILICFALTYANYFRFDFVSNIQMRDLISLMLLLQISLFIMIAYQTHHLQSWILCITLLCILSLNYFIIEPTELAFDRAQNFVNKIEALRLQKNAMLAFYKEQPDGLPIKYEMNMPILEIPIFISDPKILVGINLPTIFISSVENIEPLLPLYFSQFHIIANEKMAHVRVYAFSNYDLKE